MRFHLIILVIYVSCFLMFRTEGKYISGILKSDSDWQFLTKFCFSPSSGSLQFNMKYPVPYLTQNMLLYWDKRNFWESVYKTDLTCTEKESKLTPSDLQLFRLRPGNNDIPGLDCKTVRNGSQLQCNSQKFSFNSARPRWWYIVISNCNTRNGLLIEYEMWMRNGEIGNIFREHFSADEIYILEFNIAFFVLQLVLLILAALVAVRLRRKQLLHRTYKLYLLSLSLTLLSTLFCCITYLSYGSTGYKSVELYYLSAALQSGGTLAQQLLVLLLGLGYSVTCGRLPAWATALISALLTALTAGYTALFAVEAASADPGLVYWRWSSLPGYCLIGLQLAACLAFAACAGRTLARHRAKRSFYGPLLAVYTVWQLCLPAGAAVCAAWVPAFMRARVASGIDLCLMFIAQLAFLLLAWPAIGNPCFPYDLKTSQIGAITYEDAEERAAVGRDLGAGGDIDVHGGGGGGGGGGLGGMGKLACDPLPDGRPFAQFSLSQSRSFIGVPANNSSSSLLLQQQKQQQQQAAAAAAAAAATPVYEEIRDCSSSVDRYSAYSNTATSPRRPESTLIGWSSGGLGGVAGVGGVSSGSGNLLYESSDPARVQQGGALVSGGYPSMGVSSLSYCGFPTNERRRGGSRPSLPV
ncbi:hypothetical protein BOX15_Mlig023548g2 [Macrostomum lignano]|uniref:Uncharacterized protein n=1 Tax=Macrostomum lignano TaxID=282301 RepID=A0A267GIK8_9PLAT|nr:hypothetical protein BOX15_Mlig023548g2 [Macrostomum lignano]